MSEKVPYKKALEMLYEKNAEIDDLRTRIEECEKELFDARQGMFKQGITIEVLTKNINERNAENAALTKKLEAVREWRNSNDSDWPTRYKFLSLSKLDEILDGK